MGGKEVDEPKKITLGLVLSWLFGVVFGIAGVAGTVGGSFGFGIPLMLAALVLLPPVRAFLREKFKLELSTGLRSVIVIILLVISVVNTPTDGVASTAPSGSSELAASASTYDCKTGERVRVASECPRVAQLGEPVRAGDLAWSFTKTRWATEVGQQYSGTLLGKRADGIYLIVDVRVENTGSQAKYISSSMVKLIDDRGRVFEPDTAASIYLGDGGLTFDEINPGIVKKGEIVFDVPEDMRVARVRISNGLYGGTDTYVNLLG